MLHRIFNIIAPDHCYGCNNSGSVLCDNCKYDIETETFFGCLMCRKPTLASKVCSDHGLSYSQALCVGERHDVLEKIIDAYKFGRNSRAAQMSGVLMTTQLETLPKNIKLVPVPTIASHIRQRGFDHTDIITREISKKLGCDVAKIVSRRTNTVQRQASRAKRLKQASEAFRLNKTSDLDEHAIYVVVDDVFTTGATAEAVASLLRAAGVSKVIVAVLARQTLDDKR